MAIAKVFWKGDCQVVCLPEDIHFPPDAEEVEVRREGKRIVLEPVPAEEWPNSFWCAFEGMPEDFERPLQVRQTREGFDPVRLLD